MLPATIPYPISCNGIYTIKVEHPGFRASVVSHVVVQAAQTVRADVPMKLGEVTEVSEVSATAIALQMDSAVVGTTIDSKTVNDLPLNGRTFAQLATLVPGVAAQGSLNIGTRRQRGSIGTAFAMTANGFSDVQNNFIYDGEPAMDLDSYNFAFSPSIDAISEFRVQTNTYSAAYGGAPGAQVDVVTKSGTNGFHGTSGSSIGTMISQHELFQSHQGPAKSESVWSESRRPESSRTRLSFSSIGRAVVKSRAPPGQLLSIPPHAFRNGDFSSLLPDTIIIDPTTVGHSQTT